MHRGVDHDRTYTDVMIPMASSPDDWVASVASYVRTNFGNSGGVVMPGDVKRVREATATRKTPWTVSELQGTLPQALLPDATWKLTASHNATGASGAMSMAAWNSQTPQTPGMWFQVELPQPATIAEIQFYSTAGGGRGGGGRGAAGPVPVPAGGATPPANATAAAAASQAAPAAPAGRGGSPGGAAPNPGYPRGYRIETSMNGTAWTPVAEGQGAPGTTIISFKPVQAKFVRLTQTAAVDNAPEWSIQQLRLFEPGKPGK